MKILYHHRTKSRDGQYVHIHELQEAFRRGRHELREVAPAPDESVDFGGEARGLARIAALAPAALYELMELGYNAVSYYRLREALLGWTPDFLYERYALGNFAGVLAARRFGVPLLLEVNAPLAEERRRFGGLTFPGLARRLERAILRAADRVLVVTGVLKEMLVADGADPRRIVVVPNGVDLAQFRDVAGPDEAKARLGLDGKIVLGFTGFCRDWHGLDRVVELLAAGAGPLAKAHFLIVGDGPACPDLLALAADRGVRDRVTVTGVVPRERIAEHVAAFDVALQPAVTSYASPLKLFEYMALGKAILAPDVPNIREVVADGESAALFAPDDDGAFGAALRRLAEDAPLRARLGAGARELIESRPFTWDHNAARIERIAGELK